MNEDWHKEAECARRSLDTCLFFPEEEGNVDFRVIQACRECPVIQECLNYALDMERGVTREIPRAGIWGGMTPRQRTNLVNRGYTTNIFSHDSMCYKTAIRRIKGFQARRRRASSQPSEVRSR